MTNAAEYPARVREAFPEAKLSVQSFRDRTVLVVEPADRMTSCSTLRTTKALSSWWT